MSNLVSKFIRDTSSLVVMACSILAGEELNVLSFEGSFGLGDSADEEQAKSDDDTKTDITDEDRFESYRDVIAIVEGLPEEKRRSTVVMGTFCSLSETGGVLRLIRWPFKNLEIRLRESEPGIMSLSTTGQKDLMKNLRLTIAQLANTNITVNDLTLK